MKKHWSLLAALFFCLTACTKPADRQAAQLLVEQPFSYQATLTMGKRSYDATLTRTQEGDVTVAILSQQWTQPLIFTATAEESGISYADYAFFEPLADCSAASVAVLLRQGLLRLSAEPAQKEKGELIVKSGALSVRINTETKQFEKITLPGVIIDVTE